MKNTKLIALLILVLTSCSQAVTPTSIPIPYPSSTGTFTPEPTVTIAPSPIVYPTQVYGLLISPDGTKRVQSYDWKTFDVLDANGKVLWSITYDVNKFESDYPLPLLEASYNPFYWSKDGSSIYFTCYHGGETDTSGKYFGNEFIDGCGVFKLDVDTGGMIDILPEIFPGNGYYAFSISPDEKQLVYTYQNETPVKIKLLDLNTKDERILLTADDDILETGRYGWSPQGDKLVFMTLKMSEDEKRVYSIFLLDLRSLEVQLLAGDLDTQIRFVSWDETGVVSYKADDRNDIWQLNVESKSFSFATITPWAASMVSATSTP